MRSSRYALVAIATLTACATKEARRTDTASPATATLAGAPSVNQAAVRHEIESMMARFDSAGVRGDTATLASFYAEDAIMMWPNLPAVRGHEAIAKGFGGMMSAMKLSALKLRTEDVIAVGDYAVETGTYDLTGQAKGAKASHDVGKYLVLWKKQPDGSYKILRDISNSDLPAK